MIVGTVLKKIGQSYFIPLIFEAYTNKENKI